MRLCFVVAAVLPTLVGVPSVSIAQDGPTVRIEQSALVSRATPSVPHAEPFLAVSSRDPRLMLAGAIVPGPSSYRSAIYRSADGGDSWTPIAFDSTRWMNGVDPILYFDAKGSAFFSSLSGGFPLFASHDGGVTWNAPIQVPGGVYDRPYFAFDNGPGPYSGRMYAAGTISLRDIQGRRHASIAISSSQDGGCTFSTPRIITPDSAEEFWTIADPVVLPSGRVLLAVASVSANMNMNMDGGAMRGHVRVITSDDGASTFSAPVTVAAFTNAMDRLGAMGRTTVRAVADTSTTSPIRGRVYLTWPEFADGRYDIVVARSSDDGRSWQVSKPVDAASGNHTNPTVAVNNAGVLAVLWNDRRASEAGSSCFEVRAASSSDGGAHFGASTLLSTKPTCPEAAGNWMPIAMSFMSTPMGGGPTKPAVQVTAIPMRFLTGGETQGLVASADGRFHALWLDGAAGVMQLRWTRLATTGAATIVAERVAVTQSAPQSMNPASALRIEVDQAQLDFSARTMSVRVRVMNPTAVSIPVPVDLSLDRLSGALAGLRVIDADGGSPETGARWRLTGAGGASKLEPGGRSEWRTLLFSFTGGAPQASGPPPALLEFSLRQVP